MDNFNTKIKNFQLAYEDIVKETENIQKHTKGYIYDSLCFRYRIARMGCLEKDTNNLMLKGYTHNEASARALKSAERDCLRFYEILDEAIGEHD